MPCSLERRNVLPVVVSDDLPHRPCRFRGIKCPRVVSDTSRGCSPDPVVSQALWADLSAPPITMHDDYRPARLTQFVSVDGNYQAFEALKRLTGDVRNLMLGKDHWLTPVSCSDTTKGSRRVCGSTTGVLSCITLTRPTHHRCVR